MDRRHLLHSARPADHDFLTTHPGLPQIAGPAAQPIPCHGVAARLGSRRYFEHVTLLPARALDVPLRWAARGAALAGLVGGAVGLVVGLRVHWQTAWAATVEIGLPCAVLGAIIGLWSGVIAAVVFSVGSDGPSRQTPPSSD